MWDLTCCLWQFWLGRSRSSRGDCYCTGIFSLVLSACITENQGYPTGKGGFLQAAVYESAAFEAGYSSCHTERDHFCGRTYGAVCDQWLWLSVCSRIYGNEQAVWNLEMAAVSYGYAITTYVGQNLGAKKYQRIRKGVRSGTYMAVLTSVFISGMMVLIGRNILSLFVSGEPEQIRQVLDIAYKYLFIMAVFLWILYLLHVYRSAIQGLGNTLIPLASGIAEFVMRVSVALLLPKWIGEEGIYYAEICAWSSAAVLLIISYMILMRKYKDAKTSES